MEESQMETLWEKKENLGMAVILKKEIWSPLQKKGKVGRDIKTGAKKH